MRRDSYSGYRVRREHEDETLNTPGLHIHWESRVGPGLGRRSRLISYIFVLFGTALAAFLVLALIVWYSTAGPAPG